MCLYAAAALAAGSAVGVAGQEGTKRALIIAIGEYGVAPNNPVTGRGLLSYRDLSSANDVVLVRGALERQGFLPRDIRVLADSAATPGGIRGALQGLARDTRGGDVVVIHYSGHGHRIANDNPGEDEEVDGLDEVLVPFGAPAEFYEGYDGSLHFRDDELGEYLAQIRARAGASGSVTVFLDACYSGTGTRGDVVVRGEERPLGEPVFAAGRAAATRGGSDDDRGTGIELGRSPGTRGGDGGLAPFVVFSAASPRQMAKEVQDVDGRTPVGSLSYAVARALSEAGPGTTNRDLYAAITRSLIGKVTNQTPQMEGDADFALFSNRLTQQLPYVVVDSAVAEGVVLAGGTLVGLNPGTRLAVHPLGTASPDGAPALAELEVTSASATRAVATVTAGAPNAATRGSWAFVTRRSYGDLTLRVRLDGSLTETDRNGLRSRLTASGMVQFVEQGGDVVIAGQGGRPEARVAVDDRVLAAGAQAVVAGVEDYARYHYLRRLRFDAPALDIVLELAPGVELDTATRQCTAGDWDGAPSRPESLGASQWRLAPGALYRVRVRNEGERRAFVYLVDLRPGGQVGVLYPQRGRSGEQLEPGREIDRCFQITQGDVGQEVLKVFATETEQDLRPWFESARTRSESGAGPDSAVSREVIINIQSN